MKTELNLCTVEDNENRNRQSESIFFSWKPRKFLNVRSTSLVHTEKKAKSSFFSGNFRMLLSAVLLFSVLIFIPHFPFGAHAKLHVDCTFERIKSWTTAQNTSAPSLRFRGQLPSSKKSPTCLVKTNETNRLIYLKAKKDEWSNGESEFSFISMIKLLSFPININFTSFLCGSPPLFRPLNHFFFAGRSREEFRIRISGIQKISQRCMQHNY